MGGSKSKTVYVDREVEKVVEKVVYGSPCADKVYLEFEIDASEGFRYRSDKNVVVRVTVNNPTDKKFEAGVVTCVGSKMIKEAKADCSSIAPGSSQTVQLVLRRRSREVADMVPEAKFTYTRRSKGDHTESLPLPVYRFTGDLLHRRPTEMIMVEGKEQVKEYFVFTNWGYAGSGKSSCMCGLSTLVQQTPKEKPSWVTTPCPIGTSGTHGTEWISRHLLSTELHLVGMDGWGMDTNQWKVKEHILDYAKGYIRDGIHMSDEIASRPLTDEEREALEDTRKPSESNVVLITIPAADLIADNPTVRNETLKVADMARGGNFPMRLIVSRPDLILQPDCSVLREDSESDDAREAAQFLVDRAKKEFGIPESHIFLTIAHNTGERADTPQQRWNIDRMYLKLLEGIMDAASSSDRTRAQQTKAVSGGNVGFYAALEKGKAARQQRGG